ncbi:MAG TPA: hypothetical protein VMK12_11480, partial [Anaeromyxobacteraceae bacterium]|nr:hypothetical protein [Anaeromyxobacteraceae bacterium]
MTTRHHDHRHRFPSIMAVPRTMVATSFVRGNAEGLRQFHRAARQRGGIEVPGTSHFPNRRVLSRHGPAAGRESFRVFSQITAALASPGARHSFATCRPPGRQFAHVPLPDGARVALSWLVKKKWRTNSCPISCSFRLRDATEH